MIMNMRTCVVAILCVLLCAQIAIADTTDEINHLLDFVENSGCDFIRNGAAHDAHEARSHIERKYHYVESRVSSAEDFIRYAATQSSLSGERYTVDCSGIMETSSDWLTRELAAYRERVNKSVPVYY